MTVSVVTTVDPHGVARDFDRAAERARVGLSSCHSSPRFWAAWSPRGSYASVCSRGTRQTKPPDARRGRVVTFSRRSRSRLIRQCARIDRAAQATALFVTLTYPSSWSRDGADWKRHLDTWWKRCQRQYPRLSAIWKLEFQKRGAPHFHLLVYGQSFIPAAWTAAQWNAVVAPGDGDHLKAGTETRRVHGYRHAVYYASKYLAKVGGAESHSENVGRYWGVLGRRFLPDALVERQLDPRGAIRMARILRGLARSRRVRGGGAYHAKWLIMRGDEASRMVEWLCT